MPFKWRQPVWVWLFTVAVLGVCTYGMWRIGRTVCRLTDSICWFVPSAQPSRSYPSAAALAAALEAGGVECKNPELTHDRPTFQQIACGGTPNKAYEYLVVVFDRAERADWLKRDRTGCNGVVVFGENWHISPSEPYNVRRVVNAVGGEVIGADETANCSD